MGQTFPVTVFKYTCEGTIEEKIQAILATKQQLFDEIVDDVSLDVAARLTSDELFGLFGLVRPSPAGAAPTKPSTGLDFEERCARILRARGWTVETTPRSHDGGVDLVARRHDEIGLEQTIYVQCKDHARPVGVEVVRELIGIVAAETARALIAARSGLTAEARALAERRGVTVWDDDAIVALESALPPADRCLHLPYPHRSRKTADPAGIDSASRWELAEPQEVRRWLRGRSKVSVRDAALRCCDGGDGAPAPSSGGARAIRSAGARAN